jgi:serine protease Do
MLVAKCAPSVAMIEFENSRGSGFLVDSDLLATNAHVVGNRDNAVVRISFPSAEPKDKGPHNGRVVFLDKDRDLALVSIKSDLPFLKLGNSDLLNKGEDIVVIGSPVLGGGVLVNAISKGVYSTSVGQKGEGTYLHMSLAVNPGNSGGPAFNDRGEVVGMVTAKGVKVEGVALCVPANDLKLAIQDLK